MDYAQLGLVINFIGAVLLGITSQSGLATGWGGPHVWKSQYWKWANISGWGLMSLGFLIQITVST
jgi:hypothetical protein